MAGNREIAQQRAVDLLGGLQAALQSGMTEARKALRLVLEFANEDLNGQVASLLVPAGDGGLRFLVSTSDTFVSDDFPTVPIGSSIAGFVFLSGQSMGLDDAKQSSRFYSDIDEKSGFQTKEYLATPVINGTSTLGVLTVANRNGPAEGAMFSTGELKLADRYAGLCALLLEHDIQMRRHTAVAAKALKDSLWGADGFQTGAFDCQSRSRELQATIQEALNVLGEHDLELVRDMAERLADLSARRPS